MGILQQLQRDGLKIAAGSVAIEVNVFQLKAGANSKVAISSTVVASTVAIVASSIRVVADVACNIAISSTPTATANDMALVANVPERFRIASGEKVSVIAGAGITGNLHVTALSKS